MITKLLSYLFLTIYVVATTDAINCFIRSATSGNNGTAESCPGYTYCYSYSPFGYSYSLAGCSTSIDACSSYPSCVLCTTDYCNSMTPSSITCYIRTGSSSNNGTITACPTGVTACYSYENYGSLYGGCGICTSSTVSFSCVSCGTNNCNTATPSSISCYSRSGTSITTYTGPGTVVTCPTGVSHCFSYLEGPHSFASCGKCSTSPETYKESCVTCSTSLCNTHVPSSISCYYLDSLTSTGQSAYNNGTLIPCSTGVSSCYSKWTMYSYYNPSNFYYYNYAGCGACPTNLSATYNGCTTCGTIGCNYFQLLSFTSTTSIMTQSTASTKKLETFSNTQSGNSVGTTATSKSLQPTLSTFSIGTTNTAVNTLSTASTGSGSTAINTQTTISSGTTGIVTGVGSRQTTGSTQITVSAENSQTTVSSGTIATAANKQFTGFTETTIASNYSTLTVVVGATSNTPGAQSSNAPTTAAKSDKSKIIKCIYSVGDRSSRKIINCNSSSCFQFSFSFAPTDYSFSGCGECILDSSIINCRICNTDYCNSDTAFVTSGASDFEANLMLTAYGAVILLAMQNRLLL